jgi:hypothetical protein
VCKAKIIEEKQILGSREKGAEIRKQRAESREGEVYRAEGGGSLHALYCRCVFDCQHGAEADRYIHL